MNLVILVNSSNARDYNPIFKVIAELGHNLICFISISQDQKFDKIENYSSYPFLYIHLLNYDLALLDGEEWYLNELKPQFAAAGVPVQKIKSIYWLLQQIMTKKYEDNYDRDIQETLNYWRNTSDLTIFNQYVDIYPNTFDELHMDESCGLQYIIFKTVEGKERRMYFPAGGGMRSVGSDGKVYIKDILREQVPTSPHLYVKADHKVNYGDVLIDAGVCEGNFALRYIDVCSKIYLFEIDKRWFLPLYFTFKDCWDKIVFIPQAVSNKTVDGNVALDDAISVPRGSNIFIKMDIEGAEIDALRGAKNLLTNNKVRVSACSYHNADDCWKIKSILQSYGYNTSTSNGYMVFYWDKNIWETADFRKGIVYADNY